MNLFIIKAQTNNLSISRLYTAIIPFLFAPLLLIILLFFLASLELKFKNLNDEIIIERIKFLKPDILKNEFNVFIRLRAFSINEASINALDLKNWNSD